MSVTAEILARELATAEHYLSTETTYSAAVTLGGLLAAGVPLEALSSSISRLSLVQLRADCTKRETSLARLAADTGVFLFEELMFVVTERIQLAMSFAVRNAMRDSVQGPLSMDDNIREIARRQGPLFESVCMQIRERWQSEIRFDPSVLEIDDLFPALRLSLKRDETP